MVDAFLTLLVPRCTYRLLALKSAVNVMSAPTFREHGASRRIWEIIDRSRSSIRQLPINVHTKFVEEHVGILRELLDDMSSVEAKWMKQPIKRVDRDASLAFCLDGSRQ